MATTVYCATGLKLDLNEKAEEIIVSCQGSLTEETAEMFQREVSGRAIPETRGRGVAVICRIVLDVSKVTKMDEAGKAALFAIRTAAEQKSCFVEVINMAESGARHSATNTLEHLTAKLRSLLVWAGQHGQDIEDGRHIKVGRH